MMIRALKSHVVGSLFQKCSDPRSVTSRISPLRSISNPCGGFFFNQVYENQIGSSTGQSLFGSVGQVSSFRRYHQLFVGDLPEDATEESVRQYFSRYGMVLSVKIVRDAKTVRSKEHGFVAFADKDALGKVINSQPHLISNRQVIIRPLQEINFLVAQLSPSSTQQSLEAYFSRFGKVINCQLRRDPTKGVNCGFIHFSDQTEISKGLSSNVHVIDGKQVKIRRLAPKELTLHVGNLSPSTTDQTLHAFYSQFGNLLRSEVIRDRCSGQSRSFGFVCFSSQQELDSAMRSLPHIIDGKEIEIDYNTCEFTLFVARLPPNMSEDHLKNYFEQFGPVYNCNIARDKQTNRLRDIGWVTFSTMQGLNGALTARPHVIDGMEIDARASKLHARNNTTLFIGGLSPRTDGQMLYDVFCKFGSLVKYEVKCDPITGRAKRFGYVEYFSPNEASKALLGGPHVVDGTVVSVAFKDRSKSAASSSYGAKKSY